MSKKNKDIIFRLSITLLAGCFFIGVAQNIYVRYQYMLREPLPTWPFSFFLIALFCISIISITFAILWRPSFLVRLKIFRLKLGWTRWIFLIVAGLCTSYFYTFVPSSSIFSGLFTRLLLYTLTITIMAWLATEGDEQAFTWRGWLAALILFACIFTLTINFQYVNDIPFSLYWSEGNRLWDYSLLYGRQLYDYPLEKPIRAYTDLGRQSIWGLPFLLPNVSILFVRIWSALMFTVPYALLGWFIFTPRRGMIREWLLCGLWALVFLNQGPIYAPLIFSALLVAAARRSRLLPALILMALAGYFVRISRITWTFAPAIWAALITLLDDTSPFASTTLHRWRRALVLGITGLSGFFVLDVLPPIIARIQGLTPTASIVSIEGIQSAGSRQPLLWERLLPNSTFALGILPGLIIATAPLIVLLILYTSQKKWRLDSWQKLALLASLLTFLVVGIVVSVKIGGGSNLHNMDMFLIELLFIAGLLWDRGGRDWLLKVTSGLTKWGRIMVILAIMLPVFRDMMVAEPIQFPSPQESQDALISIQSAIAEAKQKGEVLFIDQRQLLTFGYIQDLPLVPEFEKKRMMDQAMADNATYFEDFYRDLANHRFSLIISEPLAVRWQGDEYHFGNENDAWVKWISIPVLCYYQIGSTFKETGTQLLSPRATPAEITDDQCPVPQGELTIHR